MQIRIHFVVCLAYTALDALLQNAKGAGSSNYEAAVAVATCEQRTSATSSTAPWSGNHGTVVDVIVVLWWWRWCVVVVTVVTTILVSIIILVTITIIIAVVVVIVFVSQNC